VLFSTPPFWHPNGSRTIKAAASDGVQKRTPSYACWFRHARHIDGNAVRHKYRRIYGAMPISRLTGRDGLGILQGLLS
jgi:hypothetical protein